MTDNLYWVRIRNDEGTEDAFYVLARSSKPALSKAFRKFEKRVTSVADKTLVELKLAEEDFA
jgi:hypothetical protein